MKCSEVQSLFSLYLDGALTGAQMQQVAAHSEACAPCRIEYEQLQSTQRLVAGLGKRPAPPDLALRLRVALSQARAEKAFRNVVCDACYRKHSCKSDDPKPDAADDRGE